MAVRKFEDWIAEQEAQPANQMSPGGQTPMAGNSNAPPALAHTTGDEGNPQQEEQELDELNSQMQRVMGRLLPLIGKMKNKQKGFTVLHAIGQAVQNALNISDSQAKQAVVGNMPKFEPSPGSGDWWNSPSPHGPMPRTGLSWPTKQV